MATIGDRPLGPTGVANPFRVSVGVGVIGAGVLSSSSSSSSSLVIGFGACFRRRRRRRCLQEIDNGLRFEVRAESDGAGC